MDPYGGYDTNDYLGLNSYTDSNLGGGGPQGPQGGPFYAPSYSDSLDTNYNTVSNDDTEVSVQDYIDSFATPYRADTTFEEARSSGIQKLQSYLNYNYSRFFNSMSKTLMLFDKSSLSPSFNDLGIFNLSKMVFKDYNNSSNKCDYDLLTSNGKGVNLVKSFLNDHFKVIVVVDLDISNVYF
jgi:hypothetical protein